MTHINAYVAELRRLFLVEDLVDSLKFALLLWLLTYIGAIFNGMTVVILCKLHFLGLRGRIGGICIKSSTAIQANQVAILAIYLQVVQKKSTGVEARSHRPQWTRIIFRTVVNVDRAITHVMDIFNVNTWNSFSTFLPGTPFSHESSTRFHIFFFFPLLPPAYIAMFTLPKVYETNKQNIDQYLDLVRSKIMEITDKWVETCHAIDRNLIAFSNRF